MISQRTKERIQIKIISFFQYIKETFKKDLFIYKGNINLITTMGDI